MMYVFTLLFLGLMLTQQVVKAQSTEYGEFQLVKRSGDISLYERWIDIPGEEEKQAREVRSIFYYKNSIHAGLSLLKDQSMGMKWQDHVSEFKVYPQRDTSVWYEYSYHDIPWPVSDQDHFMEYRISSCSPNQMLISFKSKENKSLAPERKGVTRLTLAGTWLLEQVDTGKVKVTYTIFSTPLDIPRMLTDPIVRSNMVSTIEDFVSLIEKP
ncbi:hypothetical protein WBG78_15695 [Chryseolinea sp. T2]|uniref:hypothetical protein n=1 Tax=Chryseolinea sp. T2 TaxID=3129255 RepID=UPI003076B510